MNQIERKYKAKFILFGFNSEMDRIELDKNVIIRKGSENELEEMYEKAKLNRELSQKFFLEYEYMAIRSSIMPNEGYDFMEKVNAFFEIFTKGSVKTAHFISYVLSENKFESIGFSNDTKVKTYLSEETLIKAKDEEILVSNWKRYILNYEKKALRIGIRRLLFSTQKYEFEDRLIDLMIAFESTYLDESEKGELSFKLALRSSYLLRTNFDRKEVFDFMKKAYSLRSSIVHGANIKGNVIKFKGRTLDLKYVVLTLTDLMRVTYMIIITERKESKMKDLINAIDYEIIDSFS